MRRNGKRGKIDGKIEKIMQMVENYEERWKRMRTRKFMGNCRKMTRIGEKVELQEERYRENVKKDK